MSSTLTREQRLQKSVCDITITEGLQQEVAVALRRWYLQNNALQPEDSVPMYSMFCGIDVWMEFNECIGAQGSDVDQQARAEWAQQMVCKVLQEAERNSEIPLLDMIAAEAPDIDGSDGPHYLLERARWRPVAMEVQS